MSNIYSLQPKFNTSASVPTFELEDSDGIPHLVGVDEYLAHIKHIIVSLHESGHTSLSLDIRHSWPSWLGNDEEIEEALATIDKRKSENT